MTCAKVRSKAPLRRGLTRSHAHKSHNQDHVVVVQFWYAYLPEGSSKMSWQKISRPTVPNQRGRERRDCIKIGSLAAFQNSRTISYGVPLDKRKQSAVSSLCLGAAPVDQLNCHRHLHSRPLPRRNRMERAPDQKSTLNRIRLNLKSVRTCATLASGRPIPNLLSPLITLFCADHSDCEKASTRTERLLPDPTAPHPSRFHPKREQVSAHSGYDPLRYLKELTIRKMIHQRSNLDHHLFTLADHRHAKQPPCPIPIRPSKSYELLTPASRAGDNSNPNQR